MRLLPTVRKHNKHGDIARGVRVGNDFGKIVIASDGGASVRMVLGGTMRPIVITERMTATSGAFRFDDEIDGASPPLAFEATLFENIQASAQAVSAERLKAVAAMRDDAVLAASAASRALLRSLPEKFGTIQQEGARGRDEAARAATRERARGESLAV